MPSRLSTYSQLPWAGGLVTAYNKALIGAALTIADNLVFTTQSTKKKRDGINHDWDGLEVVSVSRASSGTTRTLTLNTAYQFSVGEVVAVSGAGNAVYDSASATITAVSHSTNATVTFSAATDKVTWTSHGLADGTAVTFTTSGSLPTGSPVNITSGQVYFVRDAATNDFKLAQTIGGTAIDLTSAGSGTHTGYKYTANVITYTASGSLSEGATADTGITITPAASIVKLHDYWYGTNESKTHQLAQVSAYGKLIMTSAGTRTYVPDTGTAWTLPVSRVTSVTFDNRLIVAASGNNNKMKHYFPSALSSGTGVLDDVDNDGYSGTWTATPDASIVQVHQGRLWCNDKDNPERLHFSETGAYNVWQGAGDSGALDIGVGDGDPDGITAIFPTFKGQLFVAKRTKLYRISGYSPETWTVEKVSDSIGCVGPNAVAAIEQDDMYFVSDRGVHSLAATDKFGGFEAKFTSAAIQTSFNEDWERGRLKYIQAAYVPSLNSVVFSVAEDGSSTMNNLWCYNIPLDSWYRWPDVDCEAVVMAQDSDKQRLYLGRTDARVSKTLAGTKYDTAADGSQEVVTMRIKTGIVYINGPQTIKAYKKLSLLYATETTHTLTTRFTVDNFSQQSAGFSEDVSGDTLGTGELGELVLGGGEEPFISTKDVDGYGRGFAIEITQEGLTEDADILGFQVQYEAPASMQQELRLGDDN